MEAYTAVISLLRTLDQPYISQLFHDHTAETLDSLRVTAEYFQQLLEKTSNEKIKYLEEEIRVVASEAEDVVEMKISKKVYDYLQSVYVKLKDNELADLVQKNLKGPRYLVVVDDIWSRDVWDSISQIFPNRNNGSRILLTTRETEVAMYANTSTPHEMNLLDLDNSWKLLCNKVFGLERDHPIVLEKIGKKIVEKCQGLPLIISVIAGHLSKKAKTLKSWEYVAQTLSEIIASHPNKCLGVLGLSYHHLPNRIKPCFLSMGNFPEDFQVNTWRLTQLWIAEGFIRAPAGSRKCLEEVEKCYLEDLISRNLIMARKRRFNGEVKVCGIHDLLREFCFIEAEMTKFMHVVRTPFSPTQKPNVRRFSIQKAFLDEYAYKQLPPVARSMCYLLNPGLSFSGYCPSTVMIL
ncbi:hypothetical protein MTR67_017438 [Solanum verrucosum]|uniref:NB-ARC domain-containing protein n=1 Tax=Solanum verrucosum TaxID=315347 RepID=A0AAF0TRS9_SOLVR|nr:hypothetical protein MTR67_017438 [Solanum verrucosum]